MIHKPHQYMPQYAEPFQDQSVAAAYRYRTPYPEEVFTFLASFITATPRRVLDVGCGTGNLARHLVEHVEQVDAVDFSQPMIELGKQLPNGAHPNLRWLYGRIEEVTLEPPYALIMAGASLHWLDWNVVFRRFRQALLPGCYLAVIAERSTPDPWSLLQEVVAHYRMDGGFQPYDMYGELARHGLFHKVGEMQTQPVPFVQSIDDYIESYHARSGFSRDRMGLEKAGAFDQAARQVLLAAYPEGKITLEVVVNIEWGIPGE